MLQLDVVPERSLASSNWEFTLGMHFSQAVMVLQSQTGVIQSVQVVYSDSNPLSKDLIIDLRNDGIRLKFDAISQRLKIIEVYNLKLVTLKYNGVVFNSEDTCLTIDQIEVSFGATVPGIYNPEKEHYIISFRGVCFYFPVASKFQGDDNERIQSLEDLNPLRRHVVDEKEGENKLKERAVLPSGLSLHPIGSPVATCVCIFPGQTEENIETPPLPLGLCIGEVYLSNLTVLDDLSLRLALYTGGTSRPAEGRRENFTCRIFLGDSPQEVLTKLGSPGNVFYKSDNKMKIHSTRRIVESVGRTDYFFNYFSLGIDVLFDGRLHKAKKFILHTNYPGHYNFNMYHRCEFLINLPIERMQSVLMDHDNTQVTAYTKWDSLSGYLNGSAKPVVLNRASSINTRNCFGPTLCYGFMNYIFEVMQNHHIASVTVYKSVS